MTGAHPVAFYLKELSGEPTRRGGRALALAAEGASDLDTQIAEAHARGVLEGRAAGQAEQDQALAKQLAAFEKKLAAERQRWAAEEGGRIHTALTTQLADIEQRIAERVSHILKPILMEQVRAKAVQELRAALAGLLAEGAFAKITVSGPQDLLSAIEAEFGGSREGLAFMPAQGADVTVRADEAILETRIAAWADAIEGGSP